MLKLPLDTIHRLRCDIEIVCKDHIFRLVKLDNSHRVSKDACLTHGLYSVGKDRTTTEGTCIAQVTDAEKTRKWFRGVAGRGAYNSVLVFDESSWYGYRCRRRCRRSK